MAQLVGRDCVICNEKITSALSAEFCESCGNSVHTTCRENFQPTETPSAMRCSRCGGDPSAAPGPGTAAAAKSFDPLLPIVVLAIIVVVGYLLWPIINPPTVDRTQDQTSDDAILVEAPIVVIETTMGRIKARLFPNRAPETTQNFVDLVNQNFYDDIIFHRVIDGFMIQTGDPRGQGTGGRTDKGLPAKSLADEFHPDLRHDRAGLLSMANSGPNTADTQFFITTVPTPWLDDKHSIFGEVIEGLEVVHSIEKVATGAQDRPLDEVKMLTVRLATE